MPLTKKEQNYINKNIGSSNALDVEILFDVINKKRSKDNQISIEEIIEYIESLSKDESLSSGNKKKAKPSKSTKKQLEKAKLMKESKDFDEQVNMITDITAGVLEKLLPAIVEDINTLQKPRNYRIVAGKTRSVLESDVNSMMTIGWQPLGGVSAAAFGISPVGGNQYIQAMVKYK